MSFYKEEAERDLRYILTTLYQERGNYGAISWHLMMFFSTEGEPLVCICPVCRYLWILMINPG